LPVAIVGSSTICVGATALQSDATSPGLSWSSSTPAVATINGSGVVTGISGGTSTITFTAATNCYITKVVTINSAGTITGPASVSLAASIGSPVAYTDGVSGGTWTSSNTARVTIGAGTGLLTGVSGGTLTITYSVSGCNATKAITITTPRVAGGIDNENESIIRLYPNPTTGAFTLQAPADGTFAVYTLDGKQVEQYNITAGNNTLSLPKGIASGVYMCRYSGNDRNTLMVRLLYEP